MSKEIFEDEFLENNLNDDEINFDDGPMEINFFQGKVITMLKNQNVVLHTLRSDVKVVKRRVSDLMTWRTKIMAQVTLISILFPAILLWLKAKILGDKS